MGGRYESAAKPGNIDDQPLRRAAPLGIITPMLIEKVPEVQALAPADKWRLIDELWSGAPPPSAEQSLDTHVSRLRRGLRRVDAQRVVNRPEYVLGT